MTSPLVRLGLVATLIGGCAAEYGAYPAGSAPTEAVTVSPPMAKSADRFFAFADGAVPTPTSGMMGMAMAEAAKAPAGAEMPQDAPPPEADLARKIIYDAQVDLAIEDIEPSAEALLDLIQANRGYLAEQNISGSPGSRRSGRWKVRVPVERFEDFIKGLLTLGELELNQRTSQDVTEQFYDVEARIKNKKVEERTLLKILEERSGKLEDILKVEVELSRVRGEIEQMEGRLRVLANLSSLATVTINLREREKYEPTEPVVASFGTQLRRAWDDSIKGFTDGLKGFMLWLARSWIGLIFWAVGLALAFVVIRILIKRLLRDGPRLWELAQAPLGPPRAPRA